MPEPILRYVKRNRELRTDDGQRSGGNAQKNAKASLQIMDI